MVVRVFEALCPKLVYATAFDFVLTAKSQVLFLALSVIQVNHVYLGSYHSHGQLSSL
jgi:hypothetical protein